MDIQVTSRQMAFINATQDEVLFGGAAGGGKSYGQIVDTLIFALKYKGSKQLILRRTYPELEKSIIRTALGLYPQSAYKYSTSKHTITFENGSFLDFGYCDSENDVYRYQSAEYDVVRFDELTHFTEHMYLYLISRVRGANGYPKQVKSSTNPGGLGHGWVKARFIDIGAPDTPHKAKNGTRIFLPSKVQDNKFLMQSDPDYIKRLRNLSKRDRRALLDGDWDIFDGQYFTEWKREKHVVEPFEIPQHWRRYFAMDYGLDMLAGYWIAVDERGCAYVYRELYESGLIISDAAKKVAQYSGGDKIYAYIAPPDLWNRRQDTGRSAAEIFADAGIYLVKSNNDRVQGWMDLKEWLCPVKDEFGNLTPRLRIFENCVNLIRTLPAVLVDGANPNDVAKEPHELTHAPDALRYFIAGRPMAEAIAKQECRGSFDHAVDNFLSYGSC